MRFEINVNQRAIIENGLDLDLVDGAILDHCLRFALSGSCQTLVVDGVVYYWFAHKNLCEQLPILKLKPDSAYRRMKGLCDRSFLKAHPQNKQLNVSWYALCPLTDSLVSTIGPKSDGTPNEAQTIGFQSEPSEQNPMPIGPESDAPSDENPMYKTIIEEDNNLNSKTKSAGEGEILEVEAEEVDATVEDKKNAPNPVARPPSPDLSDADLAELEAFTRKLQTSSKLLFALSSTMQLKGENALMWIESFAIEQWNGGDLNKKTDADWRMHCQRWIADKLAKQKDREQQRNQRPNQQTRGRSGESRTETGSEIDRLASEFFSS